MSGTKKFGRVHEVARELGLPASWLKREAEAGRLPHIRAGASIVLNIEAVAQLVAERVAAPVSQQPDGNGGVK
jgi:hypothetical protein